MTTVVDPLGTPAPVYNRSGTVILTVVPGAITSGDTQADAIGNDGTVIPAVAQTTVAMVLTSHPSSWNVVVTLSADAEIGDVVEVYPTPGSVTGVQVFPPVGQSISGNAASTGTNKNVQFGVSIGVAYRKVSSSHK